MSSVKEHNAALTTKLDFARLPKALLEQARKLPTATLHEAAGKIGVLPHEIKPVDPGFVFAGNALTVHSPGGDNLWLHRALDVAQEGDVLVVYTSGVYDHGYWGEIMTTMAKTKKLAALVIDGCVRDGKLLAEIGFPVFARGLCIRGTGKDYGAIGWLGYPVLMGDVSVSSGDLIVGDGDGVVAIPAAQAEKAVAAAVKREADEAAICKRLENGETTMQVYGFH